MIVGDCELGSNSLNDMNLKKLKNNLSIAKKSVKYHQL